MVAEEIPVWLRRNLETHLVVEACIFGSSVSEKKFSDVDILVKYKSDMVVEALALRKKLEVNFYKEFNICLDALFLSEEECQDEAYYIRRFTKKKISLVERR